MGLTDGRVFRGQWFGTSDDIAYVSLYPPRLLYPPSQLLLFELGWVRGVAPRNGPPALRAATDRHPSLPARMGLGRVGPE